MKLSSPKLASDADGHRPLFGASRDGFEAQSEAAYRAILDAKTPELVKELGNLGLKLGEIANKLEQVAAELPRERLGEPTPSWSDREAARGLEEILKDD